MPCPAEENHAVVKASISYYGTYTVNEAEQVLDMVIDACTSPISTASGNSVRSH
jgi:hypothetical protein